MIIYGTKRVLDKVVVVVVALEQSRVRSIEKLKFFLLARK